MVSPVRFLRDEGVSQEGSGLEPREEIRPTQSLREATMKEKTLVEIRVKGASTRDSNIALRKAVEAVAADDPDFHVRMTENGIEYIVDASPGCVRLPTADAERVADRLRSVGHDIATRSLSLAIAPSSGPRGAARREYLARR